MEYKFEKLEVWDLAIKFNDHSYQIAESLPASERYNLSSQLRRASTSIALNIAEGSTGQSNAEQLRFLSFAIRSQLEVIACLRLIESRGYIDTNDDIFSNFENLGARLFIKLQAFKKALS